MSFEIGKLASAVADCGMGVRELRVQTESGRYYYLFVNGGVKACHWGGAKVGHYVPRLGA